MAPQIDVVTRAADGAIAVWAMLADRTPVEPGEGRRPPRWQIVGVFGRPESADKCRAYWERRLTKRTAPNA
jgi:hypothetical protein